VSEAMPVKTGMAKSTNDTVGITEEKTCPAREAANLAPSARERRTEDLLTERQGSLPVWIRSPKTGTEHYSGFSRAKLYELAGRGEIRSVSIRAPGQVKGTRLFLLASIIGFIEKCERDANEESKAS
jgi:hypothetical protein